MGNSHLSKFRDYCGYIADHKCRGDDDSCQQFRKEFHTLLSFASSIADAELAYNTDARVGVEVLRDCWNGLIEKVNSKKLSAKCESTSRCFLCWLFVPLLRYHGDDIGFVLPNLESVVKSVDQSLVSGDELVILNFKEILQKYRNYMRSKNKSPSSISLSLALLNVKLGYYPLAEALLDEAGNSASTPIAADSILDAYVSIINMIYRQNPSGHDDAIRFVEKGVAFAENGNINSVKKKVRVLLFAAVLLGKKSDFEKALFYISKAEAIEPSYELLMTRFKILIHSTTAGRTDFGQLATTMNQIVKSCEFSLPLGVSIVRDLTRRNQTLFAEHLLTLIWQSVDKFIEKVDEIYPFFLFRLRHCLMKCDVMEVKRMFLIFDKAPQLLSQMPVSTGMKMCSLLNRHAMLFVKNKQFDGALAYYELCDNLLQCCPNIAETKLADNPLLMKEVPSNAQIKRSLALCLFQVGRIDESEQTLKEAATLEDSPWIHFISFYFTVQSAAEDSVAIGHLEKMFSYVHPHVPGLLDLSANTALKANKRQVAMSALEFLVSDFFNSKSVLDESCGKILSALKNLIRLRLTKPNNDADASTQARATLEESPMLADYMSQALKLLSDLSQDKNITSTLTDDIKWFSEVCWHVSNQTNGLLIKADRTSSMVGPSSSIDRSDDSDCNLTWKLALFRLYHCSADFFSLLRSVTGCTNNKPGTNESNKLLLQKYCLSLSLSLAAGVQYLRMLEVSDLSRLEFAKCLLESLKDCYGAAEAIANDKMGESVSLKCGSMSIFYTLPVFEFEILLLMERIEDAELIAQNFENSPSREASNLTVEQLLEKCSLFERFSKIAHEQALVRVNAGLDCGSCCELCIACLFSALSFYRLAESSPHENNDDLEEIITERVSCLASCIRHIYQTCRQHARDKFFVADSRLFSLINRLMSAEWSGSLWKRVPVSEAEWLISCCWNASLDRRLASQHGDAKAWFTLAVTGAEARNDEKMLTLLNEKLRSLKKWEGLEVKDCFDFSWV